MTCDAGELTVGGVAVFCGTYSALLDSFTGPRRPAGPVLLVTPNVDHVIDLMRGTQLGDAYAVASSATIDGAPVALLARLAGCRGARRITGADLLIEAAKASQLLGVKLAIFGGAPGVATTAAENLESTYGAHVEALEVALLQSPDDGVGVDVVNWLREVNADFVFICLGSPKQELWFTHWRSTLPPGVYVGAGAAASFAAGVTQRAPKLLRSLGIEWTWRLASEPRRLWRRYLKKGPAFILVCWLVLTRGRGNTASRKP